MLARLDQIPDIDKSFANRSGTLLRLSLVASADATNAARSVSEVLQAEYGGSTQLSGVALTTAIDGEEWRDGTRIHELSMIERQLLVSRGLISLLVLAGIVMVPIWLRRRAGRRRNARSEF